MVGFLRSSLLKLCAVCLVLGINLGDGSQIVPPADADIASCIAAVGPVADIPVSDDYVTLDDGVLQAYIARAVELLPPGPRHIRAVYTAKGQAVVAFVMLEALDWPQTPAAVAARAKAAQAWKAMAADTP